MYFFEFHSKLKRANPKLWVNTEEVAVVPGTNFATGQIYAKVPRTKDLKGSVGVIGAELVKVFREHNGGHTERKVGRVDLDWVPEYDEYFLHNGAHKRKGWRTILLSLVEQKLLDLNRARKVFNCPSLGLDDWDNYSWSQKVARARKEHSAK